MTDNPLILVFTAAVYWGYVVTFTPEIKELYISFNLQGNACRY